MPQISLYIDNSTMEKVEKAAKAEELSISKWVGQQLKKSLRTNYPADFEDLFGAVNDESFSEPDRLPAKNDIDRASI